MAERRVRVTVAGTGACLDLDGPRAELVALVATRDLSPRTLWLLVQLVAHEPDIAPIEYGRLEVHLTPNRTALVEQRAFPKRAISPPQPGDPDAA